MGSRRRDRQRRARRRERSRDQRENLLVPETRDPRTRWTSVRVRGAEWVVKFDFEDTITVPVDLDAEDIDAVPGQARATALAMMLGSTPTLEA